MADDQFDAWIAQRYETLWPEQFEPDAIDPVVEFLAGLAGRGPVLELGIGTGRIAIPLSRRGVPVHGIDLSAAMVAELRAQPDASTIEVTVGDLATTTVDVTFTLVSLLWNTIMNLTTQEAQTRCFRNVAAHLEPGGRFVVEVAIPDLQRLPPGETIRPFSVAPTHLGFDEIDVATQGLVSHHYWLVDGEFVARSMPFRYVWPSELDLMATLAGLTLEQRWAGWDRQPFTSASRTHVSVWTKNA